MARDFAVRTYDELFQEYADERTKPEYQPIRLGFGSIDADIRGISAGQVCGIAARTAVGKTWLLETIVHNLSARRDVGILSLSLEMPGVEWAERGLAIAEDVAPEVVESWARQGELGQKATHFLEQMENCRVVDEPVSLSELGQVIGQARSSLEPVPIRLVVIDYFGLLGSSGRDSYERASAIGKGLKAVAKSERVAVIVAAQLSRAGGNGSEPVTIDMLRDSGVIEESVDFLLGAWRPEKVPDIGPAEYQEVRDVMRVAILKNRKGQDGRVVELRFHEDSRRLYQPDDLFAEA